MKPHLSPLAAAVLVALRVLAACGGGGGDAPDGGNVDPDELQQQVPDSAFASIDRFTAFLASLVSSEGAQPRRLGDARPPASDTDEPLALR